MKYKWCHCKAADNEHRKQKRQYAHTYHFPKTICTSRALWKLPKAHRDAILMHEIGHLIAGKDASEAQANKAIENSTGMHIEYVDSPYGKQLERLKRK